MLVPERAERLPSPSSGVLDLIRPYGGGTQLAIVLRIKRALHKRQSLGSKEGLRDVSNSLMARIPVAVISFQAMIFQLGFR